MGKKTLRTITLILLSSPALSQSDIDITIQVINGKTQRPVSGAKVEVVGISNALPRTNPSGQVIVKMQKRVGEMVVISVDSSGYKFRPPTNYRIEANRLILIKLEGIPPAPLAPPILRPDNRTVIAGNHIEIYVMKNDDVKDGKLIDYRPKTIEGIELTRANTIIFTPSVELLNNKDSLLVQFEYRISVKGRENQQDWGKVAVTVKSLPQPTQKFPTVKPSAPSKQSRPSSASGNSSGTTKITKPAPVIEEKIMALQVKIWTVGDDKNEGDTVLFSAYDNRVNYLSDANVENSHIPWKKDQHRPITVSLSLTKPIPVSAAGGVWFKVEKKSRPGERARGWEMEIEIIGRPLIGADGKKRVGEVKLLDRTTMIELGDGNNIHGDKVYKEWKSTYDR